MTPSSTRRETPSSVVRALSDWLTTADVIDVKTVATQTPLRAFAAAALSFQPGWVTFLYAVRAGFVRLLGMRQAGLPRQVEFNAESLPSTPGAKVGLFSVHFADEHVWACDADDTHLWAGLGVVEDTSHAERQLHVVTVVRYKKWSGPVYFNVIRPFHHLVVRAMIGAGLRARS